MEQVFITHTEEQVIKRTTSTTSLPSSLTSIYKDLHRYASLLSPGTGMEFLLYLLTKMDSSNKVNVNSQMIRAYSASLPSTPTTERTFFRLLKSLVNNGALAKQSRGVYLIQPSVIHGRLGIPLEVPSILPLEEEKSISAPVPTVIELKKNWWMDEITRDIEDKPILKRTPGMITYEEAGNYIPVPQEVKDIIEDAVIRDSTLESTKVEVPDEIESMFHKPKYDIKSWDGSKAPKTFFPATPALQADEYGNLPDISTHTEVMSIEEAKKLYPDKANQVQKIKASLFDHGPGGVGDAPMKEQEVKIHVAPTDIFNHKDLPVKEVTKGLTLDDIVLPVVEEKKQPKLNLSGGRTFRI